MGYSATHLRRATVTIPAAWFDEALTNFPVLFTTANLPSESFDADVSAPSYPARADGADRRFSTDEAGDTPWNRQIVVHGIDNNPANGTAEIWACCPLTSAAVDIVRYTWWGDADASEPDADSAEGSEGVWDDDFIGVYHLQESNSTASGNYKDSTANAVHMTGNSMGMSNVDAKWGSGGKAAELDGSDDYMVATISSTDLPVSMSSWVYADAGGVPTCITNISERNLCYQEREGSTCRAYAVTFGGGYDAAGKTTWNTGAWYHIAGTYEATSRYAYLNGAQGAQSTDSNSPTGMNRAAIGLYLDGFYGTPQYAAFFNGRVDEARFSEVYRSAAWIAAEYNTGNAPGDVTVGTPESPGGGGIVDLLNGKLGRPSLVA